MGFHLPKRKRWAADKRVWVYNSLSVRRVLTHSGAARIRLRSQTDNMLERERVPSVMMSRQHHRKLHSNVFNFIAMQPTQKTHSTFHCTGLASPYVSAAMEHMHVSVCESNIQLNAPTLGSKKNKSLGVFYI